VRVVTKEVTVFWTAPRKSGLAAAAAAPAPTVRERTVAARIWRARRFVRCASRLETSSDSVSGIVPAFRAARRSASSPCGVGCGPWAMFRTFIRAGCRRSVSAGWFMRVSASRASTISSSWRSPALR
jgi:hypothetical protein